MAKLTSSHIADAEYDRAGRVLTIRFVKGGSYEYQEVPEDVYESLLSAESAGKFFAANIKGKFKSRKLQEPDEVSAGEEGTRKE